MAKIQDANFYVTHGWMITKLKLSGRALQVYAIIYGFTQDQETEFNGSLNYIADWLGTSSRHTVLRAIDDLIEKGLIEKRQAVFNGVTINKYVAIVPDFNGLCRNGTGCAETAQGLCRNGTGGCAETAQGLCRNGTGGCAETAHNIYINKNIDKNIGKDIDKNSTPAQETAPATFKAPTVDDAIAYFIANGYTEDSARRFFSYYDCAGWKDSNGKSVRNWKQKAQAVWFKDENKISKPIYNRPYNQDACYESVEERVARFMRETGQVATNEDKTQNNATVEPSGGYLDYLNMASDWEPNQK